MASQRFFIIDDAQGSADGLIQNTEKSNVGIAYNQGAPNGTFINCYLKEAWIITNEEYKEYKELKKK